MKQIKKQIWRFKQQVLFHFSAFWNKIRVGKDRLSQIGGKTALSTNSGMNNFSEKVESAIAIMQKNATNAERKRRKPVSCGCRGLQLFEIHRKIYKSKKYCGKRARKFHMKHFSGKRLSTMPVGNRAKVPIYIKMSKNGVFFQTLKKNRREFIHTQPCKILRKTNWRNFRKRKNQAPEMQKTNKFLTVYAVKYRDAEKIKNFRATRS